MHVDGDDMSWSLVTADSIMKHVKRSTASSLNYMHILTVVLGVIAYLFFARLLLKLIAINKFKNKENEALSTILLSMPIYMIPMFPIFPLVFDYSDVVAWFNYSPSYFLWGDVMQEFGEQSSFNKNIFWGVLVSLFVSIGANFATAKLAKKASVETPQTGS